MLPEQVDKMLLSYQECTGRCEYLTMRIQMMERQVASLRQRMVEDAISTTAVLSEMPHRSGISNPTERLAVLFADGYEPDYIKDAEREIEAVRKELEEKQMVVQSVNAWLKGLNEKENWIIRKQVIDGAFWRETVNEYREKYGMEYSRDGLKRIKRAAMEKIYRMAK